MKKHASMILRIAIAVAGLAYIIHVINWTDTVELAASDRDYVLDDSRSLKLDKPAIFPITSGDFDPQKVKTNLTIDAALHGGSPAPLTVTPAQLNAPDARFKLRPGIVTTLRHARKDLLLWGWLLLVPIYPITALRWWMLLRTRGIDVPFSSAFRLSMVGCFFNYCMPGSTGGDVIKAYYAAKKSDRRADTIMTVVIDRIVGLLGLIVLAGMVGMFIDDGSGLVHKVLLMVWAIAGAVILGSALYFSRRIRKATGLDWLIKKLSSKVGFIAKLDEAATAYSDHKGIVALSILMSLPVHFLIAVSGALSGYALGIETPILTMLAVLPVCVLIQAIPISVQGVGTTEVVAIALLQKPELATANQIVVMLMLMRIYQLIYSLTGSVFLIRGDIHLDPESEPT